MKFRIALIALLTAFLFANAGAADAHPWRGRHCGWYRPRPVVRVYAPITVPRPPVAGGGYWGGYYRPRHYCGPRYYGYRHRLHCYR